MKNIRKFKRGAASFYIVAFSTLILVIIATSFATVILSDTSRSKNDDLSQSAYDSALAGVEDAKVAFSNYRRCVEAGVTIAEAPMGGGPISCKNIIWWMQNPDCYMVGHILGKIPSDKQYEVTVGGTEIASGSEGKVTTTNQAYTCVKINTDLSDYRAMLNAKHMAQVIRAGVADGGTNTVSKIKIGWYSVRADNVDFLQYTNFQGGEAPRVTFAKLTSRLIAVPPTLEVQIVQTGETFALSDFDKVESGKTNRGTVYLVPSNDAESASKTADSLNYIGVWKQTGDEPGVNLISADKVVKTNDHSVFNRSFAVYCDPASQEDFYCSAEIELPGVIGTGDRANDTFMIGVSLPYQKPDTDFSIQLICENGGEGENVCGGVAGERLGDDSVVKIKNTQISIDSTGRANDLYRRVETRLETSDTAFGYGSPYYALQILGNDGANKDLTVRSEVDFKF